MSRLRAEKSPIPRDHRYDHIIHAPSAIGFFHEVKPTTLSCQWPEGCDATFETTSRVRKFCNEHIVARQMASLKRSNARRRASAKVLPPAAHQVTGANYTNQPQEEPHEENDDHHDADDRGTTGGDR